MFVWECLCISVCKYLLLNKGNSAVSYVCNIYNKFNHYQYDDDDDNSDSYSMWLNMCVKHHGSKKIYTQIRIVCIV